MDTIIRTASVVGYHCDACKEKRAKGTYHAYVFGNTPPLKRIQFCTGCRDYFLGVVQRDATPLV